MIILVGKTQYLERRSKSCLTSLNLLVQKNPLFTCKLHFGGLKIECIDGGDRDFYAF